MNYKRVLIFIITFIMVVVGLIYILGFYNPNTLDQPDENYTTPPPSQKEKQQQEKTNKQYVPPPVLEYKPTPYREGFEKVIAKNYPEYPVNGKVTFAHNLAYNFDRLIFSNKDFVKYDVTEDMKTINIEVSNNWIKKSQGEKKRILESFLNCIESFFYMHNKSIQKINIVLWDKGKKNRLQSLE